VAAFLDTVIKATWKTDRYPFSSEPIPGFKDSSNLDIVDAYRQVKCACTGIQGEAFPSQTAYKLRSGRARLESEFHDFLTTSTKFRYTQLCGFTDPRNTPEAEYLVRIKLLWASGLGLW
jgi:hypothetical protein